MPSRGVVDLRKKRPGGHVAGQAPLPLTPRKRVSPTRVRRRRARVIAISLLAALAVSLALIASYVSYLPQYSIRTVEVEGASATSPAAIADYAETIIYDGSRNFFSRANIFLYPQSLIEKGIPLEFPRVASASISRAAPLSNSITVSVTERQSFALWCAPAFASGAPGPCFDMDQTGFIFASASSSATTTDEYVFSGGIATSSTPIGQTFAPGHTAGLVAFLQQLDQSGFSPLGAAVESDEDFTVPLSAGYYLDASFGEDPGTLVNNLQLVLSSSALAGQQQNLEYVDLRFGDKVYYKLKGQDQESASQ